MNFILRTDSYKLTHWDMYPLGTTNVYSYLEARKGGAYEATKWFGLQYYLKEYLEGQVFDSKDIDEAEEFCDLHFARKGQFNREMWEHILRTYGGRLPIRIMSAPEGLTIPVGNVLMTVENTDPKCAPLTNAIESLLLKVWYPTTVATLSYHVQLMFKEFLEKHGDANDISAFMLHDFGYRGVSSEESAQIGGMAHLLNFSGTDTVPAIMAAQKYYGMALPGAFSVAASEHSIMTSEGVEGEVDRARRIIANHPNQIVSLVADSYDYYNFVKAMCKEQELVNRCKVKLVIRPDSVTAKHSTPEALVSWTLNYLANNLTGVGYNSKGRTVIPYGVLWGDGIDPKGIRLILQRAVEENFSPINLVYGMGAGLLQKVNRDTCRFAFKCSAQKRDGAWFDIQKRPLDGSKASKKGRLKLVSPGWAGNDWETVPEFHAENSPNILQPTFENGVILKQYHWNEVKVNG